MTAAAGEVFLSCCFLFHTDENGILPKLDNSLPAGTYELREIEAKAGYQKLSGYIGFTVSETGAVSLDSAPEGTVLTEADQEDGSIAYTLTIRNYRTVQLLLRKISDAGESLRGAKFQLCRMASAWEAVSEYAEIDMTETAEFSLACLTAGHYRLMETHAPEGYVILTKCVYFHIAEDGTVSLTDESGSGENGNELAVLSTENGPVLSVINTAGAALPATGGMGTGLFQGLGIILVLTAGALLLARKRVAD